MHWNRKKSSKIVQELEDDLPLEIPENAYESYQKEFLKDWENARDRHPKQKEILNCFFDEIPLYLFIRAGRKFSKTSTMIDAAWKFANSKPNRVIYYGFPSISQAKDIIWTEKRLQKMDCKDPKMQDKYVAKCNDKDYIVHFKNGSFIQIIGTWTESKGRGTQPDLLLMDELQDCKPYYLDSMDPNLAAKNASCILSGTPPRTPNQYNEWWERVGRNPRGKRFKFTSYDNLALPHLKEWLDNKRSELIQAGREDEWLREYMAEDCFSSSERVLPDLTFIDHQDFIAKASNLPYNERIPILGVSVQPNYFCAILAVLNKNSGIYIMDRVLFPQIWNRSFSEMYPLLQDKIKTLQNFCGKRLRKLVWDDSNSFGDVIQGFSNCRKDPKWQVRGLPLLREMVISKKIHFSQQVGDIGLEFQKLLMDESQKEIEKNYPNICALAMIANEYFQRDALSIEDPATFDRYEPLRKAGIICPPRKKGLGESLFTIGF